MTSARAKKMSPKNKQLFFRCDYFGIISSLISGQWLHSNTHGLT